MPKPQQVVNTYFLFFDYFMYSIDMQINLGTDDYSL